MTALREQVARDLLGAYRTGVPIKPPSSQHPDLDVRDAYAIQQAQVQAWAAQGRLVRGHKVGLTSAAMQRQMGVGQPDFGVLRDDMILSELAPIPVRTFVQPRIEPEIAVLLGRPLAGPGVTTAHALAAVESVLPALEIIDSRIEDWRIGLVDTIADNASSGAVVLGSRAVAPDAIDLRTTGCNLFGNGELRATGAGGAVLGSPLLSLVWLANVLGGHGAALEAGQIVLTGSLTAAQPVRPGDTWVAQFAGLGPVTARFTADDA